MNRKEIFISSTVVCVGYLLAATLYAATSCEKVIKAKPKSTPVFSLEKQEWLEKQVELKDAFQNND
jgi:hypothetical protein